jgi:hypothetical protein
MIRKLFCGISAEEIITLITLILDENARAWAGRVEFAQHWKDIGHSIMDV